MEFPSAGGVPVRVGWVVRHLDFILGTFGGFLHNPRFIF